MEEVVLIVQARYGMVRCEDSPARQYCAGAHRSSVPAISLSKNACKFNILWVAGGMAQEFGRNLALCGRAPRPYVEAHQI